jgi:pimeloyl-ACP methyl ester carboxylesterase
MYSPSGRTGPPYPGQDIRDFQRENIDISCLLQVQEISVAIAYIRATITKSPTSPVVLMGHSTGCQDLMHYLLSPTAADQPRPDITGVILQAPVSDREAILEEVATNPEAKTAYEATLSLAKSTPKDKHKSTLLPMDLTSPVFGSVPLYITRFLSVASPDSPESPESEDYFSSDLFDAHLTTTFGRIGSLQHLLASRNGGKKSILVMHGAVDRSIPPHVDKLALIARWKEFITKGDAKLDANSQVIEHANHDISGESLDAREARLVKMRSAVLHYLDEVVGSVGEEAHAVWERDMNAIKDEIYAQKLKDRTGEDAKL